MNHESNEKITAEQTVTTPKIKDIKWSPTDKMVDPRHRRQEQQQQQPQRKSATSRNIRLENGGSNSKKNSSHRPSKQPPPPQQQRLKPIRRSKSLDEGDAATSSQSFPKRRSSGGQGTKKKEGSAPPPSRQRSRSADLVDSQHLHQHHSDTKLPTQPRKLQPQPKVPPPPSPCNNNKTDTKPRHPSRRASLSSSTNHYSSSKLYKLRASHKLIGQRGGGSSSSSIQWTIYFDDPWGHSNGQMKIVKGVEKLCDEDDDAVHNDNVRDLSEQKCSSNKRQTTTAAAAAASATVVPASTETRPLSELEQDQLKIHTKISQEPNNKQILKNKLHSSVSDDLEGSSAMIGFVLPSPQQRQKQSRQRDRNDSHNNPRRISGTSTGDDQSQWLHTADLSSSSDDDDNEHCSGDDNDEDIEESIEPTGGFLPQFIKANCHRDEGQHSHDLAVANQKHCLLALQASVTRQDLATSGSSTLNISEHSEKTGGMLSLPEDHELMHGSHAELSASNSCTVGSEIEAVANATPSSKASQSSLSSGTGSSAAAGAVGGLQRRRSNRFIMQTTSSSHQSRSNGSASNTGIFRPTTMVRKPSGGRITSSHSAASSSGGSHQHEIMLNSLPSMSSESDSSAHTFGIKGKNPLERAAIQSTEFMQFNAVAAGGIQVVPPCKDDNVNEDDGDYIDGIVSDQIPRDKVTANPSSKKIWSPSKSKIRGHGGPRRRNKGGAAALIDDGDSSISYE